MNRRGFFGALAGAVTAARNPDKVLALLKRTPVAARSGGNQILTPQVFSKMALHQLKKQMAISQMVSQEFEKASEKGKIGSTITVPKPYRFRTKA